MQPGRWVTALDCGNPARGCGACGARVPPVDRSSGMPRTMICSPKPSVALFPGKLEGEAMEYLFPREFPPAARAKVAAKKILAARDFVRKQSARGVTEIEAALRTYILEVFLHFAEEACRLGRQGVWSVEQVEREAREFLRLTTIEAGGEMGFDRSGHKLRSMIGHWGGSILPEVQREFERSPEWRRFTDDLLRVAELQAGEAGSGSVEVSVDADLPRVGCAGAEATVRGKPRRPRATGGCGNRGASAAPIAR